MELIKKQIELESEITALSRTRYTTLFERAVNGRQLGNTKTANTVMVGIIADYSAAIKNYLNEMGQGKATTHTIAYKCLTGFRNTDTIAFLALKAILNELHQTPKIHAVIQAIANMLESEFCFCKYKHHNRAYYNKLMGDLNSRNANTTWKYIVLNHQFKEKENFHLPRWSGQQKQHIGLVLIELLMPFGLIEIFFKKKGIKTIRHIAPTKALLRTLENLNAKFEISEPVYLPMVVRPKDWTGVYDGGYLSPFIRKCRFIKHYNTDYLRRLDESNPENCYSAVNLIQSTAWRVNDKVLGVVKDLWEKGGGMAGLPSREDTVIPDYPYVGLSQEELTEEQRLEVKAWKQRAVHIYRENLRLRGLRLSTAQIINIANKFSMYKDIYYPHQLDFRGRVYPIPVLLQPQGNDLAKGLLTFSNGKALDKDGVKWLKIHLANMYGQDKESFDERVHWVDLNTTPIKAFANDPVNNPEWAEADKPFQFLAACFEYAEYLKNPDGFISTLSVSVDGTCSGIQQYSALLKDEIAGASVNLIASDRPQDIYGVVADKLIEKLHEATNKELAQNWLELGINRKLTKRPVMVLPYGATMVSRKDYINDYLVENHDIDYLHKHFGELGTTAQSTLNIACIWLEGLLWEAIKECLPSAVFCMSYLRSVAKIVTAQNKPLEWITPLGLLVNQVNYAKAKTEVRTEVAGKISTIKSRANLKTLDIGRQVNGICPNFIHSQDAACLMLYALRCDEQGIKNFAMVHDSYGTLASDMERAHKIIRETFCEVYSTYDVLEKFVDDITSELDEKTKEKLPKMPKYGSLSIKDVLESKYFFN